MNTAHDFRVLGLIIMFAAGFALIAWSWWDSHHLVEEDDEMCCDPDYSYELNRYVHNYDCKGVEPR